MDLRSKRVKDFRAEVVRWRTLPTSEHVLSFLGVAQIRIDQDTFWGLVSSKIEGNTLTQQARHLVEQGASEDQIVQTILRWVHIYHSLAYLFWPTESDYDLLIRPRALHLHWSIYIPTTSLIEACVGYDSHFSVKMSTHGPHALLASAE